MANGDPTISVDPIVPQTGDQTPAPSADTPPPAPKPSDSAPAEPKATADDFYKKASDYFTRADAYMKKQEETLAPMYEQLQKSMSEPLPKMPQLQQIPQAPDQQANAQALEKGRLTYLAIALPLAFMLGRKGRNASWLALGAFGQGLAELGKNNQAAANESYKRWQEAAQNVKDQNKEQMDQYREILSDRKLNLEQQMSLIGLIAQQYGNTVLHADTQAKNSVAMGQHLQQQEHQAQEFDQHTKDLARKFMDMGKDNPERQAWASKVKEETKGKLDPYSSPEAYDEADRQFPFYEFDRQYMKEKSSHGEEDTFGSDPFGMMGGKPDEEAATKELGEIGVLPP